MKKINNWIENVDGEKGILRRATGWNLVASLVNASMTAIIIFFMSRTGQAELAGIFSIATAIAYQVQAIGFFGVRNFHITDVQNQFSFSDYAYINIFSSVIMIGSLLFIIFHNEYSTDKAIIVLIYSLFRALDIYEALFHDEYQRKGRIDIGLILQTIRYLISLTVLIALLLLSKNMILSILGALLISIILIFVQNRYFYSKFGCFLEKIDVKKIKKLFWICLPICVSGFISMYLTNAPKYSIDAVLNDQIQGIFAILFVPVFTINLLSTVIYRPYISQISQEWADKNKSVFLKLIGKQLFIILLLTLLITGFGYLIGLKWLEIIYSTDLSHYMSEFLILLIGGGLNTLSVFLSQILIIVGYYQWNLIIYVFSMIFTVAFGNFLVADQNVLGAAFLYSIPSIILVGFSFVLLMIKVNNSHE